jgi:hypothetical protein
VPTTLLRLLRPATALTVAVVASLATPAIAQTGGGGATPIPPAPAVVNSWALTPSGETPGQPSTRPNLSYELAPGAVVKDSVTLLNYSNVQLTFRIYPTDAFNNVDGQFDLLPGEKEPVDAGSWVTLPQANITVPALASATLPITVSVPPDATPGDHAGAILAASSAEGSGPDGKTITLDRRTGSRLYVRVAGPVSPALDIEQIQGTYHATLNPLRGTLDLAYIVRNTGNVRLAARQRLVVRTPFGLKVGRTTPVDVPELLPGNSVTLTATLEGVPAGALLGTSITLTPLGAGDAGAADLTRSGRTFAVPWSVLALLLVAFLLQRATRAYRRHQREHEAPPSLRAEADEALVP